MRSLDSGTALQGAVQRMARREARSLLLAAPARAGERAGVLVAVQPCPDCGADETTVRGNPSALPPAVASLVPHGVLASWSDHPVVTMLGCEMLTARALVAPAVLVRHNGGPHAFRTRAVEAAEHRRSDRHADGSIDRVLMSVDRREARVDGFLGSFLDRVGSGRPSAPHPPHDPLVLPSSTRRNAFAGLPPLDSRAAHFLSPHLDSPQARSLERTYRRELLDAVAAGL
jgi:hypothetical protein